MMPPYHHVDVRRQNQARLDPRAGLPHERPKALPECPSLDSRGLHRRVLHRRLGGQPLGPLARARRLGSSLAGMMLLVRRITFANDVCSPVARTSDITGASGSVCVFGRTDTI